MTDPINKIDESEVALFRACRKMDRYAVAAVGNAKWPGKGTALGLVYCALKLNGEAGELAEHVGKAMRDDGLTPILELPGDGEACEYCYAADLIPGAGLTVERRAKIIKEVGDNLWYLAAICRELGITLSEAAEGNLDKLLERDRRGSQHGEGDDR